MQGSQLFLFVHGLSYDLYRCFHELGKKFWKTSFVCDVPKVWQFRSLLVRPNMHHIHENTQTRDILNGHPIDALQSSYAMVLMIRVLHGMPT